MNAQQETPENIVTPITNPYEVAGYFKDYYINNKYFGSQQYVPQDREMCGYWGRRPEVVEQDLHFKSKKVIKAGTHVVTELQMICGKPKNRINKSKESTDN